MKINDIYSEEFVFTQEDVNAFAKVSGDKNPIHIDENYAKDSIFKKPIIHGFLAGSRFSKILGMNFPGEGTIYLGQEMKFLRPMFVGRLYVAELKVVNIIEEKNRLNIETRIFEKESGENTIVGNALIQNTNLIFEQ